MKKNSVAYGLFDGCMVPCAVCSLKNLESSTCSDCESHIILPISIGGALGFRSMVWFQGHDGDSPQPFHRSKTSL